MLEYPAIGRFIWAVICINAPDKNNDKIVYISRQFFWSLSFVSEYLIPPGPFIFVSTCSQKKPIHFFRCIQYKPFAFFTSFAKDIPVLSAVILAFRRTTHVSESQTDRGSVSRTIRHFGVGAVCAVYDCAYIFCFITESAAYHFKLRTPQFRFADIRLASDSVTVSQHANAPATFAMSVIVLDDIRPILSVNPICLRR